jgi:hypothetical protein
MNSQTISQALTNAIRLATASQVHNAGIPVEQLTDDPRQAEAIRLDARIRRLIDRFALK